MGKGRKGGHGNAGSGGQSGGQDGSAGGLVEELFTWPGSSKSKENIADNEACRSGWRNTDKQD